MISASHPDASPFASAAGPLTLVFDLDGTLVDSAPDLMATLNVILAREGAQPLPVEAAGSLIGAGARALLERGFAAEGRVVERGFAAEGRVVEPARMDELFADFLAHYGEHLADATRPFPGVEEALRGFAAAGHRLAVCTNKITAHSRTLLEALGLADLFAAVCGRDAFAVCKPDPGHLLLTIEQAGGDPGRAVMVGDSKTDIATAQAAGVPSVCVSFGYTDIPARELGATRVIDAFSELPGAVAQISAGLTALAG